LVENSKNNRTDQHEYNNKMIGNGSEFLYPCHISFSITMTCLDGCRRCNAAGHHIGHGSQGNGNLMAGLFYGTDLSSNKGCRCKGSNFKYILQGHRGTNFKNALYPSKFRMKKGKCLGV